MDNQATWENQIAALGLDPAEVLVQRQVKANIPSGGRRQTCKACGEPHKLDFTITDEIWEAVVPAALKNRVVCLDCFDSFAFTKGIDYASHISDVHFAGDQHPITFTVSRLMQWRIE